MPTHPCRSRSSSPPRSRRASPTARLVVVPDVAAVPEFSLDAYLNEAPLFTKPPIDAALAAERDRVDRELELEFEQGERANRKLWGSKRAPLGVAPNAPFMPAM